MHFKTTSSVLLAISVSAFAASIPHFKQLAPKFPASPRVVHEYSNPTWLENIAVRPNGDILATELSPVPNLYHIANPESPSPISTIIHTFNSTGSISGITEVKPDVFILVGFEETAIAQPVPRTGEVWKVDFSTRRRPIISKVSSTPNITLSNGIIALPGGEAILIADSYNGYVYRFDLESGHASLVLNYPEMKPLANDLGLVLGVNGLHIYGDFLYFTNSFASTIYRIRINLITGHARSGAVIEPVTHADTTLLDDFIMDNRGGLYAAAGGEATIRFAPHGAKNMTIVAGSPNSLSYAGPTAMAFGRSAGRTNYNVLYVTTDGGIAAPVNGSLTEGGKIIALYPNKLA